MQSDKVVLACYQAAVLMKENLPPEEGGSESFSEGPRRCRHLRLVQY